MANPAVKRLEEQGVIKLCACGCGKVVRSSRPNAKYFNKRHYRNHINQKNREYKKLHPKPRKQRTYHKPKDKEMVERLLKNLKILYKWACERNDWFYKSDTYDIEGFDKVWICGESNELGKRCHRWSRLINGMLKLGLIERKKIVEQYTEVNYRTPHYLYRAIPGMLK